MKWALPSAATTISARRMCAAKSLVAECVIVTVALSRLRVNNKPSGRPTVNPRPTTTTSAPLIGTLYCSSKATIARGVHGSGAC